MPKIDENDSRSLQFLKWIDKNKGYWYLICTPGEEHMTIDMMKKLIVMLAEESYYEMIFVLLMVHRNESFIKSTQQFLLLELLITGWKEGKKDKIVNFIIKDLE